MWERGFLACLRKPRRFSGVDWQNDGGSAIFVGESSGASRVPMNPSHTLIIGGTGMLAAATRELAGRSSAVTVVARRPERIGELAVEHVERVAVDYHDADALLEQLEHAIAEHGEFDFALTWVHASGEASLRRVAERLAQQTETARLVDVQGSAAARPDGPSERHAFLSGLDGLDYQRVILGFVPEDGHSRWLTDREISDGIIEAVDAGEDEHIVGVVEPWDERP